MPGGILFLMNRVNRKTLGWLTVVLLLVINGVVLVSSLQSKTPTLRISFLDVGQGDAILIQGPTGIQVLVDGGPDRSVVRELPKVMGPLDRSINLIVGTHTDKDHISGLADVLQYYQVGAYLAPDITAQTNVYDRLVAAVEAEPGIETFFAHAGMRVDLGGGAYADVLYPDRDVSQLKDSNNASIVLHVVYGDTSFMLTGDLPSTLEDMLVRSLPASALKSTVLKAGHHGSKYSTDALWLRAVQPEIVVISAGKGNTYGHPSSETLKRVNETNAEVVSTIESGTITLVSDGKRVVQK